MSRRVLRNGGTLQEEADDNSWKNWFSNIWSALTNNLHLPKRFRKFIKAHGRDKIESLHMVRAPVGRPGTLAMQLLTAGKWDEFKRRAGVDAVYHTGLVINGNLVLEKLDKLEGRVDGGYLSQNGKAESYEVPLKGKDITVAEFMENARKKMGSAFYTYDFLKHNCQNFVMDSVEANGLLTPEGRKWIKQDIDKLIQELPAFTKKAGVAVTDVARDIGNIAEELVAKRGGQIHGFQCGRSRRTF